MLPVGISFYIFQALGYSIDVYKGKVAVERNFFTYALFVSFFPQLVAGPIERSTNLLPQFHEKKVFSYENIMSGVRLMLWGYFLKLALADRCGLYVDPVFNNVPYHNGSSFFIASLLFAFQIYGDFAGYSPNPKPAFHPDKPFTLDLDIEVEQLKMHYLQKFIDVCRERDIKVVFAISPMFCIARKGLYAPIDSLAKKNGIPFLDYHTSGLFLDHPEYYRDGGHLWDKGAKLFTSIFAHDLKQLL